MLSLNQVVSCSSELGTAGAALPPPVVPVAMPKGVPTLRTFIGREMRKTAEMREKLKVHI